MQCQTLLDKLSALELRIPFVLELRGKSDVWFVLQPTIYHKCLVQTFCKIFCGINYCWLKGKEEPLKSVAQKNAYSRQRPFLSGTFREGKRTNRDFSFKVSAQMTGSNVLRRYFKTTIFWSQMVYYDMPLVPTKKTFKNKFGKFHPDKIISEQNLSIFIWCVSWQCGVFSPFSLGRTAAKTARNPLPAVLASDTIVTCILLPLVTRAPGLEVPQKRPSRWRLMCPSYTSTKSYLHRSLSRSSTRKERDTILPRGTYSFEIVGLKWFHGQPDDIFPR